MIVPKPSNVVIDFETAYDSKGKYSLRNMSMVEYVRDPRFRVFGAGIQIGDDKPVWVPADGLRAFFAACLPERYAVIGHNVKFDGFILTQIYGVKPVSWIDTKGMSRAVHGKSIKNHSLAVVAEHYGFVPKGIMKTDGLRELSHEQEKELSVYCLHDVELTAQIFDKLAVEFPDNQYAAMNQTIEMFVNPVIRLDVPLLETTAADEGERRANIFAEIGIPKETFASNKKFPALLESRGFEIPTKTSPRTNKEIPALALGDIAFLDLIESENDELRGLCEARVAAKSALLETRSRKLARIGATGSWSFDVEFSGANQTHRYSGGSGAGGNPQNFTRNSALRGAVCAPEGHRLIVGDFSNIELRIVAYLSKDPGLIQAIEQNIDLYCDFASTFYGRKITKENEAERRFGKCAILGLGYGMGAKKFARTVRVQVGMTIDPDDAARAVDLYRARYWNVPKLWARLDDDIPNITKEGDAWLTTLPVLFGSGAIHLPSGLKMRYPNLRQLGDEWVYDAWDKTKSGARQQKLYGGKVLENISQGLAGELCKEVAVKFGAAVTGLVHDEIHLCVPEEIALLMAKRLENAMSTPPAWLPQMKLKAEVGVGKTWLGAK